MMLPIMLAAAYSAIWFRASYAYLKGTHYLRDFMRYNKRLWHANASIPCLTRQMQAALNRRSAASRLGADLDQSADWLEMPVKLTDDGRAQAAFCAP